MEADEHRPGYPPKTPPPQPKPISPEHPHPPTRPVRPDSAVAPRRAAAVIRNRRAANWTLENAPWSPKKAAAKVVEQLAAWGYPQTPAQREMFTAVTSQLTRAALADGGRRITVHVADQDETALIMVLSHQSGPDPDPAFLTHIHSLGVISCGAETERDEPGNRRWALLPLGPGPADSPRTQRGACIAPAASRRDGTTSRPGQPARAEADRRSARRPSRRAEDAATGDERLGLAVRPG